ncbi:MAG: hypothetical protein ABIF77_18035 [bacterium]
MTAGDPITIRCCFIFPSIRWQWGRDRVDTAPQFIPALLQTNSFSIAMETGVIHEGWAMSGPDLTAVRIETAVARRTVDLSHLVFIEIPDGFLVQAQLLHDFLLDKTVWFACGVMHSPKPKATRSGNWLGIFS